MRESQTLDPVTSEVTTTREIVDNPTGGTLDEIHVTVRDSGPGLEKEMLDRLFQPFTQGDGSFSRKAGGAGLGLSISKQLVTLLGGSIWLDSSTPSGSSFNFTIVGTRVDETPDDVSPTSSNPNFLSLRRPSIGLPLPVSVMETSPPPSPSSSTDTQSIEERASPLSEQSPNAPSPISPPIEASESNPVIALPRKPSNEVNSGHNAPAGTKQSSVSDDDPPPPWILGTLTLSSRFGIRP